MQTELLKVAPKGQKAKESGGESPKKTFEVQNLFGGIVEEQSVPIPKKIEFDSTLTIRRQKSAKSFQIVPEPDDNSDEEVDETNLAGATGQL